MENVEWKDIKVMIGDVEIKGITAIKYTDYTHYPLILQGHQDTEVPIKISKKDRAAIITAMKTLILIIILATAALSSRAQTVQALADSSFAHQQYSQAFDYYAQVVKADASNVKALRRMGFCFMNFQGQELNATRYFAEALKIQPADPISNYYMGVIFMDEAKKQTDANAKGDFKAKAAVYLNKASSYGSKEAESAVKLLNTI